MRVGLTTLVIALAATCAFAQVYVDANLATGANDGSSWDNAYQGAAGLQAGIDDGSGDVYVAAGTYDPIVLATGAVVLGGFNNGDALGDRDPATKLTVIDGGNAETCVKAVSVENTVLDGFILENGEATTTVGSAFSGGGFYGHTLNATNAIRNLVVRDNHATGTGGGMYLAQSNAVLEDCVFDNNVSGSSGGGAAFANATGLTVADCTFSNNATTDASTHGGGAVTTSGTLTFDGCVFENNNAVSGGGGIFVQSSACTVTGCRFENNVAGWVAGGLALWTEGPWTVTDSEFIGNTGTGGGLRIEGNSTENDTATVSGCTFTDNVGAGNSGSAMVLSKNDAVLVTDCVISGGAGTRGAIQIEGNAVRPQVVNTLITEVTGSTVLFVTGGADFVNCTIAGNLQTNQTIVVWGDNSALSLLNCVVWGNHEHHDPSGDFGSWSGQPPVTAASIDYSVFQYPPTLGDYDPNPFLSGTGNLTSDPQYVDAPNGDYRLFNTSPALNTGDAAGALVPDHDLLGAARPGTIPGVTMGAYEEGVAPPSATVPDVSGQTQGDAIAQLEALGFVVSVVYEHSDTVAADGIIGTNPAVGSDLPIGSTVQLIISLGPADVPVEVPAAGAVALIGLGLALAAAASRKMTK